MSKLTSSRQQIKIKAVKNNVLVLPGNRFRIVLEVSALNLELKSDREQDILMDTYKYFLNALPCPIQILIRVRELDVDDYIESFQDKLKLETEAVYKQHLADYCDFVRELVKENRILSRKFYLIIPYDKTERSQDFTFIKEQLRLYQDVVSRELEKLGIQVRQLSSLEILQLFQNFYNPGKMKVQPLTLEMIRTIETSLI